MSEETSSTVGDPQGKNFRRAYYESLLFRGEEEEKNVGCLESLLKAACIGKPTVVMNCVVFEALTYMYERILYRRGESETVLPEEYFASLPPSPSVEHYTW